MARKRNIRDYEESVAQRAMREQERMAELLGNATKDHPDYSGNPPAKSFLSTGRNCPKCAGQLRIREWFEEEEVLHLKCSKCGSDWHHEDLAVDSHYRNIPDEMILRYQNRQKRS